MCLCFELVFVFMFELVLYYYTYIILYTIIIYYIILYYYTIILYIIISYTILFSSALPNHLPPQSSYLIHSILVGTYIYLFIFNPKYLTPHVLSEWMVEVCWFDEYVFSV